MLSEASPRPTGAAGAYRGGSITISRSSPSYFRKCYVLAPNI